MNKTQRFNLFWANLAIKFLLFRNKFPRLSKKYNFFNLLGYYFNKIEIKIKT